MSEQVRLARNLLPEKGYAEMLNYNESILVI